MAEYQTIKVPAGGKRTVHVGPGETWENVLVDLTANNAKFTCTTSGSGWTIRNIGFKGRYTPGTGGNSDQSYLFVPGVSNSGGRGLIENVYMGDGAGDFHSKGAIWVNSNMPHRGEITFRNVYCGNQHQGLYGSGPGTQGSNGTVRVENCYFYSNTVGNVRTGRGRNVVKDTVIHVDGTQPQGGYDTSSPGTRAARCVWSWYGETHLDNCDVWDENGREFHTTNGGTVTQRNSRVGANANISIPSGVPTSAEAAASGEGGGGGPTVPPEPKEFSEFVNLDGDNTLTFTKSGSDWAGYEFAVEPGTIEATDVLSNDHIDGNTAVGNIGGGYEVTWTYNGKLTYLSAEMGVVPRLNGEDVSKRQDELVAYYEANYEGEPPEDEPPEDEPPEDDPDPEPPSDGESPDLAPLLVGAFILMGLEREN